MRGAFSCVYSQRRWAAAVHCCLSQWLLPTVAASKLPRPACLLLARRRHCCLAARCAQLPLLPACCWPCAAAGLAAASAVPTPRAPSSSDLQYLTRKNMWNTKSRPAQNSRAAAGKVRHCAAHKLAGKHNAWLPARAAAVRRMRQRGAPRLPKKKKLVMSRQISPFLKMSCALKYTLKGVITCLARQAARRSSSASGGCSGGAHSMLLHASWPP